MNYKGVTSESIGGAEYFDQNIAWTVLRDGREVLLGCETWHVPDSFASHPKKHPPVKLGDLPSNYLAPIQGLDLVAVYMKGKLCLYTLPECAEAIACLELPR